MLKHANLGSSIRQHHTPKDTAFSGIFLPKNLHLKIYKVTLVLQFNQTQLLQRELVRRTRNPTPPTPMEY